MKTLLKIVSVFAIMYLVFWLFKSLIYAGIVGALIYVAYKVWSDPEGLLTGMSETLHKVFKR